MITEIITLLTAVVGAVGGSVGIIYWRENKRLKQTEVQSAQIDNELKQADWEHERVVELERKLEMKDQHVQNLYKEIGMHKDTIRSLERERDHQDNRFEQLKMGVKLLRKYRCDIATCQSRIPPMTAEEINEDIERILTETYSGE